MKKLHQDTLAYKAPFQQNMLQCVTAAEAVSSLASWPLHHTALLLHTAIPYATQKFTWEYPRPCLTASRNMSAATASVTNGQRLLPQGSIFQIEAGFQRTFHKLSLFLPLFVNLSMLAWPSWGLKCRKVTCNILCLVYLAS